jgi:hypothetical protein
MDIDENRILILTFALCEYRQLGNPVQLGPNQKDREAAIALLAKLVEGKDPYKD